MAEPTLLYPKIKGIIAVNIRNLERWVFSGKDKWIELEINISVGKRQKQPFDGDLEKAVGKKIII